MRKVLGFIWGLFKNNLVLKIMALFFAIVLWSYVLSETNPARDKVLPEVPITYTHQEQLDAQDLAISRSLSEQLEKVSVRVKVSQNYIKYLTPNSVQLTVDLSKINDIGEWTLDISATSANSNCTVVEVNPSTVTLTVDRKVTRTLPVAMEVAGSVTSGYYASDPVPEPDTVTLSGARADLENASSAVCAVDITGLTSWNKKSVGVTILDSEGNALDQSIFGDLPAVIVDMRILPKKTVPVDASGSILGQDSLAPGYGIVGDILCDPAYVEIVGPAADLEGVASVRLVQYSISGASSDVVALLDFAPPEGVAVLDDDNKAQVTITIREKTASETFEGVDIGIRNLGGGLTAQLAQDEVDVTVLAGVSAMSRLHASDIVPYVNLNGLGVGTHTVDILFEIPKGFASENFTASAGNATVKTVTVTITRG